MRILVAGASYTGRFLAAHFKAHEIHFLSRSLPAGLAAWDPSAVYDALIDTVPAVESGLPYREHFANASRLVHLSSTSVFAEDFVQSSGASLPVFDERTPPSPENSRGQKRLLLEEEIRRSFPSAVILRCGGIYGPGRSLPEQFAAGEFSRTETGNRMVSRIHVYDLCQLILACAQGGPPLVHAVDREPSLNAEVFSFLEKELSIKVPGSWRDARPSGRAVKSVYAHEMILYRYPTYREGFGEIAAGLRASGRLQ